jgi:hypothetical protein
MKNLKCILFPLVLCFFFIQTIFAQECSMYYPLVKDAVYETQFYLKNGKPNGKQIHKVVSVETTSTGTKATIEISVVMPKKEAAEVSHTYTVECGNGTIKIDQRARLSGKPNPDFKDEGSWILEIPSNPEIGSTLSNGKFSSTGKNSYFETIAENVKITGKESITTPAGTFEAYIIEYDMGTIMSRGASAAFYKHHKDWYAPGKGLVRSESFDPKKTYKPGDPYFFYSELAAVK